MESGLMTDSNVKLLFEYESDWYRDVSKYLYGELNSKTKKFDTGTLVGRYRNYNDKYKERNSGKPGSLRINDIWFTIPPTAISVDINNMSIDIPQIRSKHSVKLETGYGEVGVKLDLVFSENIDDKTSIDDEITYKIVPLLVQMRSMPFVHVDNEFLRSKLLDGVSKIAQVEKNKLKTQRPKSQ